MKWANFGAFLGGVYGWMFGKAMDAMGGKNPISSFEPRIGALQIQTSSYGVVVPFVFGKTRISGNLIWYGDFVAIPHTETQSSGGKGGGGQTFSSTTYTYQTAFAMGLCEGVILDIPTIWVSKSKYSQRTVPNQYPVVSENYFVPGSPYQITVAHAAQFSAAVDVRSSNDWQTPLVDGVDYTRSGGTYTFASGLSGIEVKITYSYLVPSYNVTALADLGLSMFTGTDPQTPWGYLTTYHLGQDLGYQSLAYVAHGSYQLGNFAQLPNFSFEVIGNSPYDHAGGNDDAAPNVIVNSVMTNVGYGANFPSAKMGSLTAYMQYCVANGIFLSPAYSEQRSAADIISELLMLTNTGAVWSEGLLKFIPYGDESKTANGQTYTPNLTPQYDLDDDAFLWDRGSGGGPVQSVRKTTADAFNQVQLEFRNRANEYNIEIVEAKDQASIDQFGLRPNQVIRAHAICVLSIARFVVQFILQRSLYFRNQYRFTLGWKYARLEPMDLVTITDVALGLNKALVRILEIEEDEDGNIDFLVEEFPFGIAGVTQYPSQSVAGYSTNYNAGVGNVSAPVIFNAPGIATVSGYEVWVAVGSTNADYGGCEIWVSTDNETYKLAGVLNGSSRYGVLTATLADNADPDTTHTCSVDLTTSHGSLIGGTSQDADLFNTLSLVGDELISFQDATLTAAYKYNLGTKLRRGVYNSPHSAHAINDRFVRLDQAIFQFVYDPTIVLPGQTIYFKFLSFNKWSAGKQLLAEVNPYSFVVGASLSFPSTVTGFSVSQNGNVVVFQWNLPPDNETNVNGFEIRYNPVGDNAWGNGTELTRVTRGTQITTAKVPPGTWNFMICARDKSNNYSRTPAYASMTVVNTNTVILAKAQETDWIGTLSNFVRHCSGVLIPESTKAANQLTKTELWEQFVPYPYATCTYTTGDFDVGFDSEVRIHGDVISLLGRGVLTGVAAPSLEMDYKLAAGAYAGFQPWTIGYVTCRYFKMRLTLDTGKGNAYIKSFTPTADSGDKTDQMLNQTIAAGGTAITFPQQYHLPPSVQVTVIGSTGLLAVVTPGSITTTGCTIHVYNTSNTDVGGNVNIDITGV